MAPRDAQQSKQTGAQSSAPPMLYLKRSIAGFMSWWGNRSFELSGTEARAQAPEALNDATAEFSARIWDVALDVAHDQLKAERSAAHKQVVDAQAKAAAAVLASGKAQSALVQLEKRLASVDEARRDAEARVTVAAARHQEMQGQTAAADQTRRDLEKRLAEAVAKQNEQQTQLAALKKSLEDKAKEVQSVASQHQQQLERAKQHYSSMESRLAALLEEHKAARQKF